MAILCPFRPLPLLLLLVLNNELASSFTSIAETALKARSLETMRIRLASSTIHGSVNPKSIPRLSVLYAEPPSIGGGLAKTLENLNDQWEIQQKRKPDSRWTVLNVGDGEAAENIVYLLEPENRLPSSIIVFTGGAVLGSYPQVAYNEFLVRLSNRLNASILAAPYSVTTLDHWELAKQAGDKTRKAIVKLQDEQNYAENLPVYSLSHSLGSKLACIYAAATQQTFQGIGLIAYNNFSFQNTISMSRTFAEKIDGADPRLLDTIFNFAEMAVAATGWEFSPTPAEMERLINAKFQNAEKTLLFKFENDSLDCADQFPDQTTIVRLPGSHLSPVYFSFNLEDLPESAVGFRNVSFGDEGDLERLVESVCDWVLGKSMKRNVEQIVAGSADADGV